MCIFNFVRQYRQLWRAHWGRNLASSSCDESLVRPRCNPLKHNILLSHHKLGAGDKPSTWLPPGRLVGITNIHAALWQGIQLWPTASEQNNKHHRKDRPLKMNKSRNINAKITITHLWFLLVWECNRYCLDIICVHACIIFIRKKLSRTMWILNVLR